MNIIITGASRGLGLNHAKFLSSNNNKIFLTDISKEASKAFSKTNERDEVVKYFKKNKVSYKFEYGDLTKISDCKKIIKSAIKWFENNIDVVICNAGGDIPGKLKNAFGKKLKINNYLISTKEFYNIFDRNFITSFNFIKTILPHMKKNKNGKIITVSSINAITDSSNEFAYSISKNAIIKMSKILARDLKKFNINVNCICPGPTKTSRFIFTLKDRSKTEKKIFKKKTGLNRVAEKNEISEVISFLCSKQSNLITGQIIIVDGGISLEG